MLNSRGEPNPSLPLCISFFLSLVPPSPLRVSCLEVHRCSSHFTYVLNLCFWLGIAALTSSCPLGFTVWADFVIHVLSLGVLVFPPFPPFTFLLESWVLGRFNSNQLIWDELGCELNLSTEGNHPTPHEFIDRGESSSRVEKLGFIAISCFSVDWLCLRRWSSRSSLQTLW